MCNSFGFWNKVTDMSYKCNMAIAFELAYFKFLMLLYIYGHLIKNLILRAVLTEVDYIWLLGVVFTAVSFSKYCICLSLEIGFDYINWVKEHQFLKSEMFKSEIYFHKITWSLIDFQRTVGRIPSGCWRTYIPKRLASSKCNLKRCVDSLLWNWVWNSCKPLLKPGSVFRTGILAVPHWALYQY